MGTPPAFDRAHIAVFPGKHNITRDLNVQKIITGKNKKMIRSKITGSETVQDGLSMRENAFAREINGFSRCKNAFVGVTNGFGGVTNGFGGVTNGFGAVTNRFARG